MAVPIIVNRDSLGTCDEYNEEDLDPRVKDLLETLNSTSEEINKLETELDMARNKFRRLLEESAHKLKTMYEKLGKCVPKSRAYYILLAKSKKAQSEAHKAAVQFQQANSVYQVAKETVALAEQRIVSTDGNVLEFDSAWQEMLNHATQRFTESEQERTASESRHQEKASEYAAVQMELIAMAKESPRSIAKSRPYFELKDRQEYSLNQERLNVEDLERALHLCKGKYRDALGSLESISNEIHSKRKTAELPMRTPGVGAESYSDGSTELPAVNLDIISETSSGIYVDDDTISVDSVSLARLNERLTDSTAIGTDQKPFLRRQPTGISASDSDDGCDDKMSDGRSIEGASGTWCIGSEAIYSTDHVGERVADDGAFDVVVKMLPGMMDIKDSNVAECSHEAGNGNAEKSSADATNVKDVTNIKDTTNVKDITNVKDTTNIQDTTNIKLNVKDVSNVKDVTNVKDAIGVEDKTNVSDTKNVKDTGCSSMIESNDICHDVTVAGHVISRENTGESHAVECNGVDVVIDNAVRNASNTRTSSDIIISTYKQLDGGTKSPRGGRKSRYSAQFPILVNLAECHRRTSPLLDRREIDARWQDRQRNTDSTLETDDSKEIFV